jgi:hypothetical protein
MGRLDLSPEITTEPGIGPKNAFSVSLLTKHLAEAIAAGWTSVIC